jgi:hypothetical protein
MALLSLDLMVRRGEKVWYHAVECVPTAANIDSVWRATHVASKVSRIVLRSGLLHWIRNSTLDSEFYTGSGSYSGMMHAYFLITVFFNSIFKCHNFFLLTIKEA